MARLGRTRVLKKNWSSPAPVSIAYVPCSRVTKWAAEPLRDRAHHDAEVGQPTHEQRVAGAEEVVGRGLELGECDHERRRVLAPVGPWRSRDRGSAARRRPRAPALAHLGVALVEHGLAQPVGEPSHPFALRARRSRRRCGAARPSRPRSPMLRTAALTWSRPPAQSCRSIVVGPPCGHRLTAPHPTLRQWRRRGRRRPARRGGSMPSRPPPTTTRRHRGRRAQPGPSRSPGTRCRRCRRARRRAGRP